MYLPSWFSLFPKVRDRIKSSDLVLGTSKWNAAENVILPESLRSTHLGILGLSGVGKTYFLENLIRQDIDQEDGFVLFDVHGDLADNIIAYAAEHARKRQDILDRVVLIEPFNPEYSVGFNPLETTRHTSPYLQTQEMAMILHERWATQSFGARTEELLRNALFTLSANNLTLLELPALLVDDQFRASCFGRIEDPAVLDYWKGRFGSLSDPMKATIREPLLTRVSAFLADPQVRHIIGQPQSAFHFEDAINQGQWVIINLSKGKLGENSSVLGSLLFTKLQLAVMAQAHKPEKHRRLFTIYADELQNLASANFATLVAEARKYNVSLVAGHQFWGQLSPPMRAAMLGIRSKVYFRLQYHDAVELAGELDPLRRKSYSAILTEFQRGEGVFRSAPDPPIFFRVKLHPTPHATKTDVVALRAASNQKYAKLRQHIGQEIEIRYRERSTIKIAKIIKSTLQR